MFKKIRENWEAVVVMLLIELVIGFVLGLAMIACFGW